MPTLKKTCRRPWQPKHDLQSGRRHSNTEFYRSTAWRKLRAVKLEQQPLCEECLKHGRHTPAQIVDHIVPINEGGASLDLVNLQSLCHACHNRKSGRERHRRKP
jgi:HNH endonuclease|nr:MAG TPA: HNH endonuclease [Caudoviricetes sp.]